MACTREQLWAYVAAHTDMGAERDVLKADCDILVYLLDNCAVTIPEENRFFASVDIDGLMVQAVDARAARLGDLLADTGLKPGTEALAYTGWFDISHTTAEWESVLSLGIAGLRRRILQYAERGKNAPKKQRFFTQILRAYDAALRFMRRVGEAALAAGKEEMAQGLFHLVQDAPGNLFEAMQTMLVYYVLQHMAEGTLLRTLGRLDSLLYPFSRREDSAKVKELVLAFIREIDTLKAPSNIPFALGGTDADGNSLVNELSYLFVEAYQAVPTTNTKFHLLCSDNMPTDLIEKTLDGVRNGKNSVVFMSDKKIIEALERLGESHADAAQYHVVGCYECGGAGELTHSCNARVNLPKALELTLNQGKDMLTGQQIGLATEGPFATFDAFMDAFLEQVRHFCRCAIQVTDLYEAQYPRLHAAPFLSGCYTAALERGGDLYCDHTAKYDNSSVNALGLGTAVDSLAAIRKLIFTDRTMSLPELTAMLRSNWEGEEPRRQFIKNRFPKYGVGDPETDCLAARIVDALAEEVDGKPNGKGGVYRLGAFSIDWRWEFGAHTAASADGRLAGEPISQNTGASFGADKEGATAHLLSVAAIDAGKTPNGSIVDLDLHASAVKGENGLQAMTVALKGYFHLGGFAVHYNVLDTEVLKRARKRPEDYPNLQVRLCGWNVLFSSLSEREKDEFIARSVR